MLTFLYSESVAQEDYTEVSREEFYNRISKIEDQTTADYLYILGPRDGTDLPNGTVITITATFTQVTATVLEAWQLVGLFGKTTYYTRYYETKRQQLISLAKIFLHQGLVL